MKRYRQIAFGTLLIAASLNAAGPTPDAQWIEDAGGSVFRDNGGRITGVHYAATAEEVMAYLK